MRRLIWFVVVIGLFIAVDSAARSYASNMIEGRLAGVLDTDEQPQVSIGGFPFLASAVDGELEIISISAERPGWGSGPIELSDVTLTLQQVKFSPGEVLRNELRKVDVGSARGTARIGTGDLSAALQRLAPPGFDAVGPESGELPIEDNRLQIGPLTLPLPTPLQGMNFERAELIDGSVELEFSLSQTTFLVG